MSRSPGLLAFLNAPSVGAEGMVHLSEGWCQEMIQLVATRIGEASIRRKEYA